MPKLLQFNPVVGFGSTGRIVENIGRFVLNNGWESHIAYSGRPLALQSSSTLHEIGNKWDIYRHAIESRLLDNHGRSSRQATKEFITKLEAIDPDVIHFHNIHGYYLNYEILIEYINKRLIPVVWTFHDFWPITGHCSYFSDIPCDKWKSKCHNCPKIGFYPKAYIDRSSRNFEHKKEVFSSIQNLIITPVSEWASGLVRQSFLKNKEVRTIYNGIDLNTFKPVPETTIREQYQLEGKKILLALATTWGERKGWSDYIRLARELSHEYVIVMVGVSPIQNKGLPENILCIQRTNDLEELVAWYSTADIVMNLSYQETFGLTTVEGFACGTPSIAYNRTASPELMNSQVGEIVQAGDIKGVKQAIEKIIDHGKSAYLNPCLDHANAKFNARDRYTDYLRLYESMMA